eukprot:COSAG05_NODE_1_length_66591_cov_307.301581_8_plen_87_part_00
MERVLKVDFAQDFNQTLPRESILGARDIWVAHLFLKRSEHLIAGPVGISESVGTADQWISRNQKCSTRMHRPWYTSVDSDTREHKP